MVLTLLGGPPSSPSPKLTPFPSGPRQRPALMSGTVVVYLTALDKLGANVFLGGDSTWTMCTLVQKGDKRRLTGSGVGGG